MPAARNSKKWLTVAELLDGMQEQAAWGHRGTVYSVRLWHRAESDDFVVTTLADGGEFVAPGKEWRYGRDIARARSRFAKVSFAKNINDFK